MILQSERNGQLIFIARVVDNFDVTKIITFITSSCQCVCVMIVFCYVRYVQVCMFINSTKICFSPLSTSSPRLLFPLLAGLSKYLQLSDSAYRIVSFCHALCHPPLVNTETEIDHIFQNLITCFSFL